MVLIENNSANYPFAVFNMDAAEAEVLLELLPATGEGDWLLLNNASTKGIRIVWVECGN